VSAPATLHIAVVSARAARGLDEDESLLVAALQDLGATVEVVAWDDEAIDYRAFGLALLRSPWDYVERLPQFLAWASQVAEVTRLENPLSVVRWSTDKHYLAELAAALPPGTVIPSCFIEPGEAAGAAVARFLARETACTEVVVKPAIGAGSRDVQRHRRDARAAIEAHVLRLHAAGRSALLQPYLARIEREGEAALIYLDGVFSHAVSKAPLLLHGGTAFAGGRHTTAAGADSAIAPRAPAQDELALAQQVLAVLPASAACPGPRSPLYTRVDLIRDDEGRPLLLELELFEPSLFLAHAPGAAARFAACVRARIEA
jgi:O-ureido-D-serine cyclo-ligase